MRELLATDEPTRDQRREPAGERRARVLLIQALIDYVGRQGEPVLQCSASRLLAGAQPDKANELLASLARVFLARRQRRHQTQSRQTCRSPTATTPLPTTTTPPPTTTTTPKLAPTDAANQASVSEDQQQPQRMVANERPADRAEPGAPERPQQQQQQQQRCRESRTSNNNSAELELSGGLAGLRAQLRAMGATLAPVLQIEERLAQLSSVGPAGAISAG